MRLIDRVLRRVRQAPIAPVPRDPDVYFVRIDGRAFEFRKRVPETDLVLALSNKADATTLRRFARLALPTAPDALIRKLAPSELRRIPDAYRSVFEAERA